MNRGALAGAAVVVAVAAGVVVSRFTGSQSVSPVLIPISASDYRIEYPSPFAATNFDWVVEYSTDLVHWSESRERDDGQTNLIVHTQGAAQMFFRMKGYPW